MGHRLPSGLGGRGHSVDMLGVGEGEGHRIGGVVYSDGKRHPLNPFDSCQ
jgi:hypothetical protein